jgi:nucleotide-binding universal stress UspA family protein
MAGGTRRIVVGVDGSGPSRATLRWAMEQARLTRASVDAVMAWQYSNLFTPAAGRDADIEGGSREALGKVIDQEGGAGPGVPVNPVVAEGHAAEVLLGAARDADLLVVGSRGHGGFAGALLGSVGQHCVQHATCPVVVIRDSPAGP